MLNSEIIKNQTNADPSSVWKACLNKIKENVTLMTYNTWFLPIKPIALDESTLRVQLPS
ncbi:MAG: chromosomal replication initiator protein DnaA, partial [Ignavibacteria bacterium]|nr:chromosomal replication initiator protein DnaA [Ignavibacteria bacterium]